MRRFLTRREPAAPGRAPAAGMFGKLPSHGDFVWRGQVGESARKLDSWLVAAVEQTYQAGLGPLPHAVRYSIATQTGTEFLVGALVPSQDRVGRAFPLSVFAPVTAAGATPSLASVPLAACRFLDASETLATHAGDLPSDALANALEALVLPPAEMFAVAKHTVGQVLGTTPVSEFVARQFGAESAQQLHYALDTFLAAASAVRGGHCKQPIVLDCPVQTDIDMILWLALWDRLQGVSGSQGGASLFWTQTEAPRLLLSLGEPSAHVLRYVTDPSCDSAQLWPLRTGDEGVLAQLTASSKLPRELYEGFGDLRMDAFIDQVGRLDSLR